MSLLDMSYFAMTVCVCVTHDIKFYKIALKSHYVRGISSGAYGSGPLLVSTLALRENKDLRV